MVDYDLLMGHSTITMWANLRKQYLTAIPFFNIFEMIVSDRYTAVISKDYDFSITNYNFAEVLSGTDIRPYLNEWMFLAFICSSKSEFCELDIGKL